MGWFCDLVPYFHPLLGTQELDLLAFFVCRIKNGYENNRISHIGDTL